MSKNCLSNDLTQEEYDILKKTTLRIAGYQHESIVDGVGIRTVVFFQGCHFNCEGCHNKHTHARDAGKLVTALEVYEEIYSSKLAKGVTFSGGEPFLQEDALLVLTKILFSKKRHITIYTGHEYNELFLSKYCSKEKESIRREIIENYVNVLITGRYIENLKTYDKAFVGSSNQEIHTIKPV